VQSIHRLQVDTDLAKQAWRHVQADSATEAEELQAAASVAQPDGEQRERRGQLVPALEELLHRHFARAQRGN